MAKKKNSKSLFEVLASGSEGASLDVPGWMKNPPDGSLEPADGQPQPDGTVEEGLSADVSDDLTKPETPSRPDRPSQEPPPLPVEEEIDEEPDEESLEEETEEGPDEEDVAETDVESGPELTTKEKIGKIASRLIPSKLRYGDHQDSPLRLDGDRLCVSVNFITAMLILGGVLMLLVAAFVLGRVTGETSPEIPAPAVDQPVKLALKPVDDGEAKLAPAGQRDADRYYLIIETLKGKTDQHHDEAERILEFCLKHGLPADLATIGQPPNEKLALWCRLGYVSSTTPVAIEHAHRVEAVGKEYFKKYGTYKFLQRRKGKFSPYFCPGQ